MIYLLDASAILNNELFSFDSKKKYFITSNVLNELKDFQSKALIENALHQNLLEIRDPEKTSIQKVKTFLQKIHSVLSKEDESILALALELQEQNQKVVVLTDDYSIQNALKHLKISFQPILMQGIKKKIKFKEKQ